MRVCVVLSVLLSVTGLLISNVSQAAAQTASMEGSQRIQVPQEIIVKEAHISLLKSALNLRPPQLPLWTPVEAALYDMIKWQTLTSSEVASSESARSKLDAAVVARLKRIAATAAPLIKTLDENQKNTMMMLARTAGLERLLLVNY